MNVDTSKIGLAAAKAMDYIESLPEEDGAEIGVVGIIVAIDRPQPLSEADDSIETTIYYAATDERLYVKNGLLDLAKDLGIKLDEDE